MGAGPAQLAWVIAYSAAPNSRFRGKRIFRGQRVWLLRLSLGISALAGPMVTLSPAAVGPARVRQAPKIAGTVEGSLQLLSPQNVTLNGNAQITGDFFVPGTPSIKLNGRPTYAGTLEGSGALAPSNYTITLNGSVALSRIVRRTNAVNLDPVAPPPKPSGTRTVKLDQPRDTIGDWATLKNLTLKQAFGLFAVPAGNYGEFRDETNGEDERDKNANKARTGPARSGFVLGVAGTTQPLIYNFQRLELSSASTLQIVGPVIVTVAGDFVVNSVIGQSAHPEWLELRIANGDVKLKSNAVLSALLLAPTGTLTLASKSLFVGSFAVDDLEVSENARVRLTAVATNLPPTIIVTAPSSGATWLTPASFSLNAAATDSDGTIAKVEFFQGSTKIGEDLKPPFNLAVSALGSGSYTYTARASDNLGATTISAAVTITVTRANLSPAVSLTYTSPDPNLLAPASIVLKASATDADGTVNRVEFFQGSTKLGEKLIAPYQFTATNLGAGSYTFTARATDNAGLATMSAPIVLTIRAPNRPPSITLTAPATGTNLRFPAKLTLTALASDSDGAVSKVEFFVGPLKICQDLVAPFEGIWPVPAAGTYLLKAVATDNQGAATASAVSTVSFVANSLPFLANFEAAEGYQLGALHGQNGWVVSGAASVVAAPVYAGQQAVSVAPGAAPGLLAKSFAGVESPITFVDFFVRPAKAQTPERGVFLDTDALQVALTGAGAAGVLQAFYGDGVGGGYWLSTAQGPALEASGRALDWLRLTTRSDYTLKRWDLYLNGKIIAADLGFVQTTANGLIGLGLSGHTTLTTAFDDLLVGFENPLFADADRDGMDDAWEVAHGLNPAINDRAGDRDADGLTNIQEYLLGTDPSNADTDHDGVGDRVEVAFGYNPLLADATTALNTDLDGDGLTLRQELLIGTDPNTPDPLTSGDLDGDGLPDIWETKYGTNPRKAETLIEINTDADNDGLALAAEAAAGTSPGNPDTDGDGLSDGDEVRHGLNPLVADANLDRDGDGLSNAEEFRRGTDPADFYNGQPHHILPFIGGDFGLGAQGLLAVRVTDDAGQPMLNAPVVLTLGEGTSQISLTPSGVLVGRRAELRTGAGGIARAYVRIPSGI